MLIIQNQWVIQTNQSRKLATTILGEWTTLGKSYSKMFLWKYLQGTCRPQLWLDLVCQQCELHRNSWSWFLWAQMDIFHPWRSSWSFYLNSWHHLRHLRSRKFQDSKVSMLKRCSLMMVLDLPHSSNYTWLQAWTCRLLSTNCFWAWMVCGISLHILHCHIWERRFDRF